MRKSVTGHNKSKRRHSAHQIGEKAKRRQGNMLQETGRADDFLQLKQRSEYE